MHSSQVHFSNQSRRILQIILLILAGESIFFLPFVLARVFRHTFLIVFDITNLELGALFSVYGVIAMAAYFFGGPLADRIRPRILLSIALICTGLGGLLMSFTHEYQTLLGLYAFWGITTILLFWAALIKATRMLGGEEYQGRAFGLLESGRGFMAAVAGSVAVVVYAYYLPSGEGLYTPDEQRLAFKHVIYFFSGWVILVGILLSFFMKGFHSSTEDKTRIRWQELKTILTNRSIWIQALIIVCAYVGYKITDDFSLLASEVLGYSSVEAAEVGTLALWMRLISALMAGMLADHLGSGSRVIRWGFALMVISGLIIGSGILPTQPSYYYIMVIVSTCIGVYAIRGLYFMLIQESRIPTNLTGTSAGIISVVGFTPDVFMGPLMGVLLDDHPGVLGHQLVFFLLAGFSLIGLILTICYNPPASKKSRLLQEI